VKKRKPIIAFDVDGTLSQLYEYGLSIMDPPRKMEEIKKHTDFTKMFPDREQWRTWMRENDVRRNASPYPIMLGTWKLFYDDPDFECIIITSTSYLPDQKAMLDWMTAHLDERMDIHFTNNKTDVLFDVIIEDRVSNVLGAVKRGRLGFVVERPWNRAEAEGQVGRPGFFLVKDSEVYNSVLEALWWRDHFPRQRP